MADWTLRQTVKLMQTNKHTLTKNHKVLVKNADFNKKNSNNTLVPL